MNTQPHADEVEDRFAKASRIGLISSRSDENDVERMQILNIQVGS